MIFSEKILTQALDEEYNEMLKNEINEHLNKAFNEEKIIPNLQTEQNDVFKPFKPEIISPDSTTKEMRLVDAISEGLKQAMEKHEDLIIMGQDIAEYGGVFKMNETEDFKSLYPLNVTMALEQRIANQVYEGLVKLNQEDLSIMPGLAEKWDVNEDATSYTFHIRKGVMFHDNDCFEGGKGREVTAKDFKYCFDRIAVSDPTNQMYWLIKDKVVGAN